MKATFKHSIQAKHLEMHSHWSQNLKAATAGFHLLYMPSNYRKKNLKNLKIGTVMKEEMKIGTSFTVCLLTA